MKTIEIPECTRYEEKPGEMNARVVAAFFLACDINGIKPEILGRQIERLHDVKGCLQIYWRSMAFYQSYKDGFLRAWKCCREHEVEHYIVNISKIAVDTKDN